MIKVGEIAVNTCRFQIHLHVGGRRDLFGFVTVETDADQFVTLAMIDSEIVSYQTSTLASGPSYTLGYLRRMLMITAQDWVRRKA